MKKWMSILLALTMLLAVGCGAKEEQNPPSGIYYDVTGLDPKATAMEVDGNAMPVEMYLYWAGYICGNLEYQLGMANAYAGLYGQVFNEDQTINWNADFEAGQTLNQFAQEQIEDTMKLYATIENMAKEQGVVLTEEDMAALKEERSAAVEKMGGQEAFENYLAKLGISLESFERISTTSRLMKGLEGLVLQQGSALYLDEADYGQYATYADHILLATVDLATQQPLSDEEIAAKRAIAEDLIAQLEAAEDLPALFAQLADEYSEDTGRAANPNGYIYTPGTMVQPFEDAAAALTPGQISGIVETNYGYHIILRKDLQEGLVEDQSMLTEIAAAHMESLLQLEMDKAEVTRGEALDSVIPGDFYVAYGKAVEEMAAADAPAEGGEATGEGEPAADDGATE